jgi:opine dehydrogenase
MAGSDVMGSVAVLGAGNGGHAAAAHLTLAGVDVRLYSRHAESLEPIRANGGLELTGVAGEGVARITCLTSDLGEAVSGADLVMLTVPGTAIPDYAARLAGVLGDGQPVLVNPGQTGGALALVAALRRAGHEAEVRVAEVSTLTYACRLDGPARVHVSNLAGRIPFAALPGRAGPELHGLVSQLYPGVELRDSVLETGMANLNAIEHPPQTLMNAGWIEHTRGDFYFYYEGTTPSVGRVIDAVDAERLALARAMGVDAVPFVDAFAAAGYTTQHAVEVGTAHQALQESEANRWFKAPRSLDHRYVHEDVGCGLVAWSCWGRLFGVATPTIDALIVLASAGTGRDYASEGLTLERMGLSGLAGDEVARALYEGDVPARLEATPA